MVRQGSGGVRLANEQRGKAAMTKITERELAKRAADEF